MSTILVTGANGFVGRHSVSHLLDAGHRVIGLVRTPAAGEVLQAALADAGRPPVEVRLGDVTSFATLPPVLADVDAVLHLAAIPRDLRGGADLRLVNTEGSRAVVEAMRAAGIRRLVHMGAMGVEDDPTLHYASSKAKAEALVRSSGLDWTILKPSLQFGPGDGFFNIIADLVRLSPGVVPVPGRGDARFQPIHVDDVARVATASFADPATIGGSFELGGPRIWSYREITDEVLRALGKRRLVIPMPVPLIRLVAGTSEVLHLPFPVATDQLRQLRLDNVGALDVIPSRFGFRRATWPGSWATCAGRAASRRDLPHDRPVSALRTIAAALLWLVAAIAIALGAAGLVTAMDPPPNAADQGELTAGGDALVAPHLDAIERQVAGLAADVGPPRRAGPRRAGRPDRLRPGHGRRRHRRR